jgi:uncharacterized membrane protein
MQLAASIRRHFVHPVLIALPVGLWILSLFCDLLYLAGAEAALWSPLALYTMVGGFAAALAAHVPINLIVVSLYALNLWLRLGDPPNTGVAIVLSVMGVGILAVSSWLGERRIHVQGVRE